MDPSHGLQFFKNCSSISPFHRVQSFSNGLLQQGHSSCQKTCSCVGSSPQAAVPARSLLRHGLCTGCSFLQGTSTSKVTPTAPPTTIILPCKTNTDTKLNMSQQLVSWAALGELLPAALVRPHLEYFVQF
ncbi:hypothetical protein QYF61_005584 [Mycteria americana]|uniref:Uncharacterized protein n=1 Tax=Mycteria americana TaxID=33587 RepID=A0AAN7MB60_MYCAM|nr:hypothetical protein QYF61_005584 [Mycteria americana]